MLPRRDDGCWIAALIYKILTAGVKERIWLRQKSYLAHFQRVNAATISFGCRHGAEAQD